MNNKATNLNMSIVDEERKEQGDDAVIRIEVLNSKTGERKETFDITLPRAMAQMFLDRVWDDVIATMPNVTIARLLDSRTGKVVTEISLKRDAPRALLPGPTMTLEGLFKPLSPEEP